jgi:hypothetical protein
MEYLINVGLAFVPHLISGLFIWVVASEVMKRMAMFKGTAVYRSTAKCVGVYLSVMLAVALTSPSITYKHQTFDRVHNDYQIELIKQQQQRTDLFIEDRTRPDAGMTQEEWDKKSSYAKDAD